MGLSLAEMGRKRGTAPGRGRDELRLQVALPSALDEVWIQIGYRLVCDQQPLVTRWSWRRSLSVFNVEDWRSESRGAEVFGARPARTVKFHCTSWKQNQLQCKTYAQCSVLVPSLEISMSLFVFAEMSLDRSSPIHQSCFRLSSLGFLRLIAADGCFFDPDESIADCGLRRGDSWKVWKISGFVLVLIVASSVRSEQSDLEVS